MTQSEKRWGTKGTGYSASLNEVQDPTVFVESSSPGNVSAPLQAVTKAKAVYVETRSRILKGTLAPGSGVNQEALAADLGVSITPLREALRRLEIEGLIRLEAHRTMIITPLTSKELVLIREEFVEGPTSRQDHIEIADAIAARRTDSATRLMGAHIERSHARIAALMMAWAANGEKG